MGGPFGHDVHESKNISHIVDFYVECEKYFTEVPPSGFSMFRTLAEVLENVNRYI